MSPTRRAQVQIHFCVVLWGFTAILGKLITLAALPLVFWRMVTVSVLLACVPRTWRGIQKMSSHLFFAYVGIGCVVALHWLTFYGAIKLSNASVAVTCIALGPVFLAGVEPWIARRPFDVRELLLGVAVVPGVALVVGGVAPQMRAGILVGTVSALLVAVFSSFNKRLIEHADPVAVTAVELGAGALFLGLLAPMLPHRGALFPIPGAHDAMLIAVLAGACTLLPYILSLVALRHLTAFGAQLAVNLEPVYAILIAAFLLREHRELTPRFYAGVAIILAAVFAYPLLQKRRVEPPAPEVLAVSESK